MPLTVLVADSDPAFRDRVRRLLGETVWVVAEAGSGDEAVELAGQYTPSLALVDVGIPGLDSLAAIRRITERSPTTKVILLTSHDEDAYLSDTGKSGAHALLPKQRVRDELLSTIRRIAERRYRKARPREVAGWDGAERRRPGGSKGPSGEPGRPGPAF